MSRLPAVHPRLVPTASGLAAAHDRLVGAWRDYVTHTSPDSMAVSLETASYLLWLCETVDARRVMDMGSGFTSYVLRQHTENVLSVDDSAEWLAWTARFLERYGVKDDGLLCWPDQEPAGTFDLIVYDFGKGDTRERWMGWAADHLRPGGLLLFDDAQNGPHQEQMRAVCIERRMDLFGLQDWTKDRFGRFAALAVRP